MDTNRNFFISPRIVVGLCILLIGIIYLLSNLDVLEVRYILYYWPAILIILGFVYLIQGRTGPGRLWALILIFIGTGLLLDRLYFIDFNIWHYWPLILVFFGGSLIWQSIRGHEIRGSSDIKDANSYIKAIAVLGGYKRSSTSQDFKGGELTAVMGGLEIDLREAAIKNEAIIDIFVTMGGIELRVPDNWLVINEGFPILGGFEDKTRPPKDGTAKRLIVRGTTVMGGMEIKN